GPLGAIRKAWTSPSLDGKVYAQPLIAGDLVIVATEGDSVYALARDSGAVVWRAALGQPVSGRSLPCGNIDPSGITGTPVGDCGAYKGAVVSVAADGSGDLGAYIVPTTREAGIWAPGGPVVDGGGHIWVATGNSESNSRFDYGNAVIHLSPALSAVDYFAPT